MAQELKTYEPLFLKYRPQSLDELVGQESIKQILKNAILSKKLVNAYLFTGPRGTGKTSTARIFAKSLNCLGDGSQGAGPTVTPCQKCSSCIGIVNSTSLDVVEIDAASHGNVDDARSLIEKVNLASIAGNYKIYIIDEVHMLSTAAFNALLKVFEEPPEKVVFILATTEEDKVLPTIVSRCQKFSFKPISIIDEIKRLKEVATQENIDIDDEALELIAKRSDGGMRDALSLLDQLSVFSEKITRNRVLDLIGGVSVEDLMVLQSSLYERDAKKTLDTIETLYAKGKEAIAICRELNIFLLDLLEKGTHEFDNFELVQMIEALSDLEYKIKQSSQAKNLLRAVLLKICHRQDFAVIKDLVVRIESLEQNKVSGSVGKSNSGKSFDKVSSAGKTFAVNSNTSNSGIAKTNQGAKIINENNKNLDDSRVPSGNSLVNTNSINNPGDANDFLDYLSPACKGIFISSKAYLASVENNTGVINIPIKFKFLKSKLEAKSEELLSAIKKSNGDNVVAINFVEIDEEPVDNPYQQVTPSKPVSKPFMKTESGLSKNISEFEKQANNSIDDFDGASESSEQDDELEFKKPSATVSLNESNSESDDNAFKARAGTGNHKLDEAIKMTIDTFGGKLI